MIKRENRVVWILVPVIVLLFVSISFFTAKKFIKIPYANSISREESFDLLVDNSDKAVFGGKKTEVPYIDLSYIPAEEKILGVETGTGEKRVVVDLTTQTLKAYQGDELFMETKISSGKWYPTPTGEFTIWYKVRSTKMSGGEGASYYYLPNVPYVMYFSNSKIPSGRGFAIHGAYWHNNLGHAMSHGCVNMRTIDAQKLFYWVDPPLTDNQLFSIPGETGTKIIINGKAQ